QGLKPIDDDALLDEVTALVERPNVVACHFESDFLAVPSECLILTMKANQKYFPLVDAAGALTNRFLVVSNIRPDDASRIVEGNERVVRPRLADAKFFFDQDRKKPLAARVDGLARVVYHGKLGSQGERVQRVRTIAKAIAEQAYPGASLGPDADRAALLAKADLLTDMVGEFPELQGVMGGYYARHDGEPAAIAEAIEDHYKPRFAGDALPRGDVGVIVALADKLETLIGLFGIGQVPTGDKDPFALRRHALGAIRMLIERAVPIGLDRLVGIGAQAMGPLLTDKLAPAALIDFIYERLAGSLREQGYSAQEVEAVLSLRPMRLADVSARLAAVRAFAALPEAASLAAANKRVGNILKKADGVVDATVQSALLKEPAESALSQALAAVRPKADHSFDHGDYTGSLRSLAALREPVDAFFESVMVNADDPALRANRLGLLAQLHAAMNRVADLSKLAT
ncbi:MAG TPA: glycine--tRNA ligase subunit beta, partial [Burkholderiaceae bacterium]|nr:glycine--tRNA ligase subunit beta [Burkholderiaceae bacterium]